MKVFEYPFLVGATPVAVRILESDWNQRASQFYNRLDPLLFPSWVRYAEHALENPLIFSDHPLEMMDEAPKAIEAARIRFLVPMLLEALFAHVFANLQAPDLPEAWLLRYSPRTLRKLVGFLAEAPWQPPEYVPTLRSGDAATAWLFGGATLLGRADDNSRREIAAVKALLTRLAGEYCSADLHSEYNATKHGARSGHGPWALSVGRSGTAPPAEAQIRAPYGTHFSVLSGFSGEFYAFRRRSHGWDVERDLRVARVTARLLHNLFACQRTPPGPVARFNFADVDLADIFARRVSIANLEIAQPGMAAVRG